MEKLKLHDNHSFETKREAGLDNWTGHVRFEVEAHAMSDTDLGMQFLQTINEMDQDELIELYKADIIRVCASRSGLEKTPYR